MAHAASLYDIPAEYFHEILDGVESDLSKTRFANFEELREYCYKVASTVGLVCIEVFGYSSSRAIGHAVDMGIALQLTNILRDVKEDADRGRIYIPQDEMARFGCSEDDLTGGALGPEFRALMKFQIDRARGFYQSAAPLFALVEPDSRACLRVLHSAYSAILDRIERSGYDVFSQRIGISARQKLLLTCRLWAESIGHSLPAVRRLI